MRTFQGIEWDMDSVWLSIDYTDEPGWQQALEAATAPYGEEGFQANFNLVEDPDWAGATEAEIREVVTAEGFRIPEIFVVDSSALVAPYEVLVIGLREGQGSFRCPADKLSEPQNNLALSNMDLADFTGAVDDKGVYHGFE